jgi:aspartate racemase
MCKEGTLGIIGGMGPLASAEFLRTIYEHCLGEREQESPVVMLYSDPTFPDRTEEFLADSYDILLGCLTEALYRLYKLGVSRIVICCITLHHLLPRLPQDARETIISLLDVIFETVLQDRRKNLLLCTNGTRKMRLFQNHDRWREAEEYIVLPDKQDQQLVHTIIYQSIKRNGNVCELVPAVESLLLRYQVDAFIAGCTDIHLLAKLSDFCQDGSGNFGVIDPLTVIAQRIAEGSIW